MGFFRKIAGLLRSAKDDLHESKDETDDQARTPTQLPMEQTGLPRKGISIPVQVAVDRPRNQIVPLLAPCTSGDGGVQGPEFIAPLVSMAACVPEIASCDVACWRPLTWGLSWYAKRLRIDEDGDVADEFLDEVPKESLALVIDHRKTTANFKVKYNTMPAKVKTQVLSDGKLQQCVEHQGKLQWV